MQDDVLRAVKGDGAEMLGATPDGDVHKIKFIPAPSQKLLQSYAWRILMKKTWMSSNTIDSSKTVNSTCDNKRLGNSPLGFSVLTVKRGGQMKDTRAKPTSWKESFTNPMRSNSFSHGLALLAGLVIFSLLACAKSDDDFMARLERASQTVTNSPNATITISAVTDFEWDNLFIFEPYTPVERVQAQLGYKWDEAEKTDIDSSDGFNLLVFMKNGKVARYFKVSRQIDFKGLQATNRFSRRDDIFEVKSVGVGESARINLFPKRKGQSNPQ